MRKHRSKLKAKLSYLQLGLAVSLLYSSAVFPQKTSEIAYRNSSSAKDKYSSKIEFSHLGDAVLTFTAPERLSGKMVELFNSNKLIAEGMLRKDTAGAKTTIVIQRQLQPENNEKTFIKTEGRTVDSISWNDINKKRIRAFMNEEIECSQYVFPRGEFPVFYWKNEIQVENEMGKFPLKVTYYNAEFEEVRLAEKPGRYGAVIEGTASSGFTVKRYVTLFCTDTEFDDYSMNVPVRFNSLSSYGIAKEKWDEYLKREERFSFGSMKMLPLNSADAAVFLAGLNDISGDANQYETPRIKDRQWWITLKNKLEGRKYNPAELSAPKSENSNLTFPLDNSPVNSSEYESAKIESLRVVCRQWAEKSSAGHVVLIMHKGKIIFNEAFGNDEEGQPLNLDSRIWMASITKSLTGTLMMQFADQGIIDLDRPLSDYLPEIKGNNKLTVRHLFNHTSGLHIAGEWASDWNYALDNQVSQILPVLETDKKFEYHRAGYALAGKLMERLTGKALPYLFNQYIFAPLGMKSAYSDNSYGGLYCTARDLARFGQFLLNRGTFNGIRFFSEETFKKMLPQKLVTGNEWGIGISPMNKYGLSPSAFGHGAASGSVFRVDPENDLIIISARNKPGKFYKEFEKSFIESCIKLIK